MTSPLSEIGEMLWGVGRWRSAMVSTLDVNPRRVRAWAAGEEPVPEGVWRELYELLVLQADENARLRYAVMCELHPDEEHI